MPVHVAELLFEQHLCCCNKHALAVQQKMAFVNTIAELPAVHLHVADPACISSTTFAAYSMVLR
jgi:hypothetical protein